MNTRAWARAYNHLLLQLAKKKIIQNYKRHCDTKRGHALLYYKTDVFTPGYIHDYSHTNHWEIAEIVRLLNQAGFWVDILDRSVNIEETSITDKYSLVISSASTDSTSDYPQLAQRTPSATKIFYATTAAPELHNTQLTERYTLFESRTGKSLQKRRYIVSENISEAVNVSDAIFSLGSTWANASFAKYNKPIYPIRVSTAPFLNTNTREMSTKDPNHFLFLAGSGNILKGLDIALEAFAKIPSATLHVCTQLEQDFVAAYIPLINNSPNIHLYGFIPLRGRKFQNISATCRFAVFPSATEAVATAAATCIRRGLIPIMTEAVDLNKASSYAYLLPPHPSPNQLEHKVRQAMATDPDKLQQRSEKSYTISQLYTQSAFSQSFSQALHAILR